MKKLLWCMLFASINLFLCQSDGFSSSFYPKSHLSLRSSKRLTRSNHKTGILTTRGGSVSPVQHGQELGLQSKEQAPFAFHVMSPDLCLNHLCVDKETGLSSQEASSRIVLHGANTLPQPVGESLFKLFASQFEDKLVQVLVGVAVLSSALAAQEGDLHAFAEPGIISLILILNAVVGVYHKKSSGDSLAALRQLQADTTYVLRNGQWLGDFPSSDLVPGDIVQLRTGSKVPADIRVLSLKSTQLTVDESSLTGESIPVSKSAAAIDEVDATISSKSNIVFSGTLVLTGSCVGVVVGTGVQTEIGKINTGVMEAKATEIKTPLTQQLDKFGSQLSTLVSAICAVVWISNIPKFKSVAFKSWTQGAIYYAKSAIALGVAAVPEGLPAIITLALALGTSRMAKRNAIIRNLPSVETLGCTSVICTDKTGTLTTNQMVVKSLVSFSKVGGKVAGGPEVTLLERDIEGTTYDPRGAITGGPPILDARGILCESLADVAAISSLCSDARIVRQEDGSYQKIGEPTEAALKVLVEKLLAPQTETQDSTSSRSEMAAPSASQHSDQVMSHFNRLAVFEFDRDRKSMSVLCSQREGGKGSATPAAPLSTFQRPLGAKGNTLMVKGAAEVLVSRCNRMKLEDGSIIAITPTLRQAIENKIGEMSRRPQRCLALAYTDSESTMGRLSSVRSAEDAADLASKVASKIVAVEKDLILVGVCGIVDPARPEAAVAILKCRDAGIRVMMITGDSKDTAVAIAKEVNILAANDDISRNAFTGQEFFALPKAEQLEVLKAGNKVFCRFEPRGKQELISMLSSLGETTAMTGDGVNDAPALQQADIGIAMGITGSDVAKSAADMVLADDNFATIVTAVEEGRGIYSNLMSFISFLVSSNVGEIIVILLANGLGIPEPLTPMHLLWINLVTDGPPAIALGFNPIDSDVMKRPPRSRKESILTATSLSKFLLQGSYVAAATIGSFLWWYQDHGVPLFDVRTWNMCVSNCDPSLLNRSGPQTMAITVLVVIEMLKALSSVSDRSVLVRPPWLNPWLLLATGASMLLHMCILYVPLLSKLFGLVPLTLRQWQVVMAFSLPVVLLDELIKFSTVRPRAGTVKF